MAISKDDFEKGFPWIAIISLGITALGIAGIVLSIIVPIIWIGGGLGLCIMIYNMFTMSNDGSDDE